MQRHNRIGRGCSGSDLIYKRDFQTARIHSCLRAKRSSKSNRKVDSPESGQQGRRHPEGERRNLYMHTMGVSNPVKYVLRLSLFTKRTEQSTWKGKEIDSDPPIEVRWSAVQCPDDFALTDTHMAVSPSESDLGHSSSSSRSSRKSSSSSSGSSSGTGLVRIVSWASLVGDRCRWTMEQERKLAIARSELARCQKAWSSEQELWLAHVCFSLSPLPADRLLSLSFCLSSPPQPWSLPHDGHALGLAVPA